MLFWEHKVGRAHGLETCGWHELGALVRFGSLGHVGKQTFVLLEAYRLTLSVDSDLLFLMVFLGIKDEMLVLYKYGASEGRNDKCRVNTTCNGVRSVETFLRKRETE